MKVNVIEFDNKEYCFVKKININNNCYCYFVNLNDNKDLCIRKLVLENNEYILAELENEDELYIALKNYE